jgi:hypothetical protein
VPDGDSYTDPQKSAFWRRALVQTPPGMDARELMRLEPLTSDTAGTV